MRLLGRARTALRERQERKRRKEQLKQAVKDSLRRQAYLQKQLDTLIKYNMVVDSLDDWYSKIQIWIPDLQEKEVEFCKAYLRKRAFNGWDGGKWRDH